MRKTQADNCHHKSPFIFSPSSFDKKLPVYQSPMSISCVLKLRCLHCTFMFILVAQSPPVKLTKLDRLVFQCTLTKAIKKKKEKWLKKSQRVCKKGIRVWMISDRLNNSIFLTVYIQPITLYSLDKLPEAIISVFHICSHYQDNLSEVCGVRSVFVCFCFTKE